VDVELDIDDEALSELSSVPEQESSQILELGERIVREGSSLVSFFSEDADSNVGLLDHVDIVGSVTNSQSNSSCLSFLHKSDDVSFLGRRESVGNGGSSAFVYFVEQVGAFFALHDGGQLAATDHESVVSLLVLSNGRDLSELLFNVDFLILNHEDWEVVSFEETA
jgi:hypothetical protein